MQLVSINMPVLARLIFVVVFFYEQDVSTLRPCARVFYFGNLLTCNK